MNCPRCPGVELTETERHTVTIDTCPKCRGVWLDRGELERLRATVDVERDDRRAMGRSFDDDEDDDHDHDRRQPPPRRSRWQGLFDLFD